MLAEDAVVPAVPVALGFSDALCVASFSTNCVLDADEVLGVVPAVPVGAVLLD